VGGGEAVDRKKGCGRESWTGGSYGGEEGERGWGWGARGREGGEKVGIMGE